MKKIILGITLIFCVLVSRAAEDKFNYAKIKMACVNVSVGGWVGLGGMFGGAGVTVTVATYKICCRDNGYFGVNCGVYIIKTANSDAGYTYAGLNLLPSTGSFQIDSYSTLVKQMQDAVAASKLSPSDQAAALKEPFVLHITTAQEITTDENLNNKLILMPGDYTIDSNGGVTFNIGVTQ